MVCGAEFRAETHALWSRISSRNPCFVQQSEKQKYAISRALSAYAYIGAAQPGRGLPCRACLLHSTSQDSKNVHVPAPGHEANK